MIQKNCTQIVVFLFAAKCAKNNFFILFLDKVYRTIPSMICWRRGRRKHKKQMYTRKVKRCHEPVFKTGMANQKTVHSRFNIIISSNMTKSHVGEHLSREKEERKGIGEKYAESVMD